MVIRLLNVLDVEVREQAEERCLMIAVGFDKVNHKLVMITSLRVNFAVPLYFEPVLNQAIILTVPRPQTHNQSGHIPRGSCPINRFFQH